RIVVASAVLLDAVEPDVDEGAQGEASARGAVHVVQAERDLVTREQGEDGVVVPARIAELDRVAAALRKRAQERREAFDVDRPVRRKLIQDRSESVPEAPGAREEAANRLGRGLEPLPFAAVAAGLSRAHQSPR